MQLNMIFKDNKYMKKINQQLYEQLCIITSITNIYNYWSMVYVTGFGTNINPNRDFVC